MCNHRWDALLSKLTMGFIKRAGNTVSILRACIKSITGTPEQRSRYFCVVLAHKGCVVVLLQREISTGLGVAHYMLEPVQRIPRYRLLLLGKRLGLSVYLSVCLSVCLSVRPSVRPSVCLCLSVFVCCLSVCLPVCLSVLFCLSVCLLVGWHHAKKQAECLW